MVARTTLCSFVLALMAVVASGQSGTGTNARRSLDVEALFRNAECVPILNGYAPSPTVQSLYLRSVACSENAVDELTRLYRLSSPEGKIMVLMALHRITRETYQALRREFAETRVPARHIARGLIDLGEDQFDVMRGSCSAARMSKTEVLAQLDDATFERLVPWGCP